MSDFVAAWFGVSVSACCVLATVAHGLKKSIKANGADLRHTRTASGRAERGPAEFTRAEPNVPSVLHPAGIA